MLRVKLSVNATSVYRNTDENLSVRDFLESCDVDYASGITSIDGVTLQVGQIDKSFKELGITSDTCFLAVVQKRDNA